jgi:hypothetical protein
MPRSTVVILIFWAALVTLSLTELGVFLGLLVGMAVAMFIFPVAIAFRQHLPAVADAYSEAMGPYYSLLIPIYVLLAIGVLVALWGYVRYNSSGRGTGSMNLGVNLAGALTVVLVSDAALKSSGFGN